MAVFVRLPALGWYPICLQQSQFKYLIGHVGRLRFGQQPTPVLFHRPRTLSAANGIQRNTCTGVSENLLSEYMLKPAPPYIYAYT